jgi:histidinol dehydrogenase
MSGIGITLFRYPYDQREFQSFLDGRVRRRQDVAAVVSDIITGVHREGLVEVARLTEQFDHVVLPPIPEAWRCSWDDYQQAAQQVSADFLQALELAVNRIRVCHETERRGPWSWTDDCGVTVTMRPRPIQRVGVYAPGGSAVLVSTVLMNVIPAQVAECPEIIVCSPPQRSRAGGLTPEVLAACRRLSVPPENVWKIGGAQAVAALAYGVAGLEPCHMVCGPGNQYVTEAKRQVQGLVRIESLAGPTEVTIVADQQADPAWVAADMLAQAEHSPQAMAILVTTCEDLLPQVRAELASQLTQLGTRDIAAQSLSDYGAFVLVPGLPQACEIVDRIAPEHLELMVTEPEELARQVQHAGAIFIGCHTPEPVGDYTVGVNHVLPTCGTARFSSALGVDDFIKWTHLVHCQPESLQAIGPAAVTLADIEWLPGHARALRIRGIKSIKGE